MFAIINCLLMFTLCYGFMPKHIVSRNNIISMKNDNPPEMWKLLSNNFKDVARDWFVNRAEKVGIDWNGLVNENKKDMERLKELYHESIDNKITYPDYYTQPFHGYDTGNLNWDAALEGEAATLSMAVNYWKEANPIKTQDWLRYNITNNIKNYIKTYSSQLEIENIVDVGCSVGISTEFLYKTFRTSNSIVGVDLSPFFISMAKLRSEKFDFPIFYTHTNAENMKTFYDDSQELVVCNFIMHELPEEATNNIINEIYRILKPGGVIAIVDLSPRILKDNFLISNFRKWAFEVTEPHIYGYYKRDLSDILNKNEFANVDCVKNDPLNSIWMGVKLDYTFTEFDYYEMNNKKNYNDEGTLLEYRKVELV